MKHLTTRELEQFVSTDTQGLLDIESKGIYRIYGRVHGERGGAFYGFDVDGKPIFGGGNLIHAPAWWNHSFNEVAEICEEITTRYPNCEAMPSKCD